MHAALAYYYDNRAEIERIAAEDERLAEDLHRKLGPGPLEQKLAEERGDAVDEALCFGWIDSLVRRLDDARYARKFTPRQPSSRWSTANRNRYAKLLAAGRLTPAGRKLSPTDAPDGDAPRPSLATLPPYIERALKRHRSAWKFFQALPPSHRRKYIAWIDSAKREDTKARRLRAAIAMLAAGEKVGLK